MKDVPVAGLDGCAAGWALALRDARGTVTLEVIARIDDALSRAEEFGARAVGVDMPLGLLDAAMPGGRACDRAARERLRGRACSVFSPPVRAALAASDYPSALAVNRASSPHEIGISRQGWGIARRIAEFDAAMTPGRQKVVREVHPELAFVAMNGLAPLAARKRAAAGRAERLRLLAQHGIHVAGALERHGAAAGDLVDACAAMWSAARIAAGTAVRLPDDPPRDARGLFMEIWF